MVSANAPEQAVAAAGATAYVTPRPQRAVRTVESADQSRLQQQNGDFNERSLAEDVASLSASARRFAAILEVTGNVQFASSASGLRSLGLDVYA